MCIKSTINISLQNLLPIVLIEEHYYFKNDLTHFLVTFILQNHITGIRCVMRMCGWKYYREAEYNKQKYYWEALAGVQNLIIAVLWWITVYVAWWGLCWLRVAMMSTIVFMIWFGYSLVCNLEYLMVALNMFIRVQVFW